MSRHTISHADEIFAGAAQSNLLNQSRRGIKTALLHSQRWEGPIIGDVDGIIVAAVTPAAGEVTMDGALVSGGVAALDFARGILVDSSTTDTTQRVKITGTDIAGNPQVEEILLTGTTAEPGFKAFLTVTKIEVDIAMAGNLTVGTTDVLGLDVRCLNLWDMLTSVDEAGTADTGTLVVADVTTPITNETGDLRGTFDPSTTLNGTKEIIVHYVADLSINGYGVGV